MNDIYSFYQLISKYQIEIPIIQRDYAQGRDNAKAADVRKSLVEKMKNVVENENDTLFFDFVYGRVNGNKFIPFDGQQRLTTLFLFHKYVFEKCLSGSDCRHKDNCICKSILGRFSYATRQSSREFCEKLVQEIVIPSDDKKVSENIKNLPWFYPDWQKDPTVMGMLTMLDAIHNQMKMTENFKTIAERLTSGCNCPITFHFVDMGEHKLSDETYVKMNARGKQLTPFENFKASLEQYLDEKKNKDTEKQEICNKLLIRLKGQYEESLQKYTGIDGSWLDLFWNIANKNKEENEEKELPDSLMMSFFNRHFMNVWRCWYAKKTKTEKDYEKLSEDEKNKQIEWDYFNYRIQKEMPLYPTKDDFVSFDIYSYIMDKCSIDMCLTPIFNICDELCIQNYYIENACQAVWNRDEKEPQWSLYRGDKNNNNRETYPSRIAFYALMKYVGIETDQIDTKLLSQWMRVVWNIIENSTIDSPDTYQAALRLIEKLSKRSHDIYIALANDFDSFELENQYHAKEQLAEEIAKAILILKDNTSTLSDNAQTATTEASWENLIITVETHEFMKGKISALFNLDEEKRYIIYEKKEDFDTRFVLFKELLDNQDNYHFIKILLSFCNKDKPWKSLDLDKLKPCLNDEVLIKCFRNLKKDAIKSDIQIQWIKELVETQILNNSRGRYLKENKPYLFATEGRTWKANGNIVLDEMHCRNTVFSSLVKYHVIRIDSNYKIDNCDCFCCWDINFKYLGHFFRWEGDNKIYLMTKGWKRSVLKNYDEEDSWHNRYYFVMNKDIINYIFRSLDNLIKQAIDDKREGLC